MKAGRAALLSAVRAGMEISWRYAWANYTTTALFNRPFPLLEALGAFCAAAVLTRVSRGRRVYQVLGLQGIGFGCAVLAVAYPLSHSTIPFWDPGWMASFFGRSRDALQWMTLSAVLFWPAAFWIGGVSFEKRGDDYLSVCTRFDWGVAYFAILLLLRWLIFARGEMDTSAALSDLLLFPFFIFSLIAIGLARHERDGEQEFLSDYRGIGLLLSVLLGILFFGTAVVLLFLPYLTTAAEMGSRLLSSVTDPLAPMVVGLLRFILLSTPRRTEGPTGTGFGTGPTTVENAAALTSWEEWVQAIVRWGFGIFVGGAFLLGLILVLWRLIQWLHSRSPQGEKNESVRGGLLWWVRAFAALLFSWAAQFRPGRRKGGGAARLYARLRLWGMRSGYRPAWNETPLEYGLRLIRRFPPLEQDIQTIVALFNEEFYGESSLGTERLAPGARAWRRMRSPRHWPARVRSWLFPRDGGGGESPSSE